MANQLDSLKGWTPTAPGKLAASSSCPTVSVSSGKGGVGKSHIALSVGLALADLGKRVLLVDGDMGLANLHILCGLYPEHDIQEILAGTCRPEDALLPLGPGIDLLPSASGVADLSSLPPERIRDLATSLSRLQSGYDVMLVDTGAGIGDTTMNLVLASDRLLLVTTPEPTAQADAYAFLKVMRSHRRDLPARLCANLCASEDEAVQALTRLSRVSERFLGWEPAWAGWVPRQPGLERFTLERRPAFRASPDGAFARAVRLIARETVRDLAGGEGSFFSRLGGADF
ncbi:MAG TPA: MinD/ParA family protein [Fibrobacteria bacterium]|nr:MinD/ParA family protein [Fibrobacteria bacterium]